MKINDIIMRNRWHIIMGLIMCLVIPIKSIAKDTRAIIPIPDSEKRSSIHELDAYVQLSEDMTIAETRAAAWAEAKRQALEMARTYISTKTKMEDYTVAYDLVWSEAEGAVTLLDKKDFGIDNNSRYHVWVKAEVAYDLQPKSNLKPEQIMDSRLPLKVKVWTSKKDFRDGENIEIFVQGNRDFYARIVDITSDGSIIQLLPNDHRKNNFFKGGETYRIPDKGDAFDLKVMPPYGEDNIVVYASEAPLGNVELESVGWGLGRYRGSRKDFGAQTRGISVVGSDSEKDAGAEFYEATWIIRTQDGKE